MKTMNSIYSLILVIGMLLVFSACKDDEGDPVVFALESLTAGDGIDLNAATSPTNVPATATITAVFTKDVNAASVNDDIISLIRDYDDESLQLDISVDGNTITITPVEAMGEGTLYQLSLGAGISSDDEESLNAINRAFTTAGSFVPTGQLAYFPLDGDANDALDTYNPAANDIVDIEFVAGRNESAGNSARFNGITSIIEIPNADQFLAHDDFTISFWVKADSEKNGQFVLGLAAWYGFQFEIAGDWGWVKMAQRFVNEDGDELTEDNWFNGSGETGENGGWQGWTHHQNLDGASVGDVYFKDTWAHVVCTYDAQSKVATMYINGIRVKAHDFNLWPDGDAKKFVTGVTYSGSAGGNKLALGFIQGREDRIVTDDWANYSNTPGNHFKGELDDVRIFGVALSAAEVSLLHGSEN